MDRHNCQVCGTEIKVMCRRGTGICCEICEKVSLGKITKEDRLKAVELVFPSSPESGELPTKEVVE